MCPYASRPNIVRRIRAAIRRGVLSAIVISSLSAAFLFAQTIRQQSHDVKNGEHIYKSGCVTCHGATGRGAPQTLTEFQRPAK